MKIVDYQTTVCNTLAFSYVLIDGLPVQMALLRMYGRKAMEWTPQIIKTDIYDVGAM